MSKDVAIATAQADGWCYRVFWGRQKTAVVNAYRMCGLVLVGQYEINNGTPSLWLNNFFLCPIQTQKGARSSRLTYTRHPIPCLSGTHSENSKLKILVLMDSFLGWVFLFFVVRPLFCNKKPRKIGVFQYGCTNCAWRT